MSGWSPGPWTAFYNRKYDEWHVVVPTSSSIKIALCTNGIEGENREANAHLIAAAPDLAEALEALMRQALQSPDLRATEWGQEALEIARAALRRAKGEA